MNKEERIKIMAKVISISNKIIDIKHEIQILEKIRFISRNFSNVTHVVVLEIAKKRLSIEHYKELVEKIINPIFEGKSFCEIKNEDGEEFIPLETITKHPIQWLSQKDLNVGFIPLIEIIKRDKNIVKKYRSVLLDIKNGILIDDEYKLMNFMK